MAVIGKSGSGKSTLINMITAIDRPTSGEVLIGDTAVHTLSEGRAAVWRGCALDIVFQFFQLLPTLSLLQNVMLPMDFRRMYPPRERAERALRLLEQVGMAALHVGMGDHVRVEMPDGRQRTLRIAGSAHDLTQPATPVSGLYYGYITFATLAWLGQPRAYNQLHVDVARDAGDRAYVARVAARVRDTVEHSGHPVSATVVPVPGRLWVYDAVQSMLVLLEVLGVCSLFMSGFLVVNTIAALLAQQVRQIGVMKAVGAGTGQLVGMYLATVLAYCILALVVAVPLGAIGALSLIGYATHLLDFNSPGFSLPPSVLALEALAGVAVPLVAALVPVISGSRMTIRQAISSYGAREQRAGVRDLERWPQWIRNRPRPLLLTWGNTFRRKGRLALTLTTLILSGAILIAVLSVRASLLRTLADVYGYHNDDVQITFSQPFSRALVVREALRVPGVATAEGWGLATAQRVTPALGSTGADIAVIAPPAASGLIRPTVLRGRWLRPSDGRAVVVNADLLADDADARVGATLRLTVDGRVAAWTVVGIVGGELAGPIAYINYPALARFTGAVGLVDSVQAVTARHDGAFESQVARALEARLKSAGLHIISTQTTVDQRAITASNFDIIVVFLLSMSVLLAVVGGLGLMGTMSINVLERTREIGIMRAIGASDGAVMQVVLGEGILVGVLSWLVGAALAVPLSRSLSDAVGAAFIQSPLSYTFATGGVLLWLVGVIVLAALASPLPAWSAVRLTVRDVLAYE